MSKQLCNINDFTYKNVEVFKSVDENDFKRILQTNRPAILQDCNLGPCTTLWKLQYLTEKLGDESVTIHKSKNAELDFISKNFEYQSCRFSQFSKELTENDKDLNIYLRSTNKNPRAKKQARIEDDFPQLSQDLKPPHFIPFGKDNKLYHSSVLRLASSNVQIWTHFDLYDNVLCQVEGRKRVILIPPDDTKYIYVKGDKSLVNNFDDWKTCLETYPLVKNVKFYKAILNPGDLIFIPSLWWHNIRTIQTENESESKYSIGFNIFWRDQNLEPFYSENDIYGNKNPAPFDAALSNLDKAISHIDKLPSKFRSFYKQMLLEKLHQKVNQ